MATVVDDPEVRSPAVRAAAHSAHVEILAAKLDLARRRLLRQRLLHAAIYGLTAALSIFCILLAIGLLRGERELVPLLLPAIGIGALVLLGSAVVELLRLPARHTLARVADRTLGTQERISTTLEVSAAPSRMTAIARLLVQEAAHQAAQVDPQKLTPLRLPRATLATVLLAVLAGILLAVPLTFRDGTGSAFSPEDAPLVQQPYELIAEELVQLAAIAAEEAERREDPNLEALARDLAELSERLDMGHFDALDDLYQAFEELLEVASDAFGLAGDSAEASAQAAQQLEQLLEEMRTMLESAQRAEEQRAEESSATAEETGGDSPSSELTEDQREWIADRLTAIADEFQRDAGRRENADLADLSQALLAIGARVLADELNTPREVIRELEPLHAAAVEVYERSGVILGSEEDLSTLIADLIEALSPSQMGGLPPADEDESQAAAGFMTDDEFRRSVAEELMNIGDALDFDAERRENDELAERSQDVYDLATRVLAGQPATVAELIEELEGLRDDTSAAYARAGVELGSPEDLSTYIQELIDRIRSSASSGDGGAAAPQDPAEGDGQESGNQDSDGEGDGGQGDDDGQGEGAPADGAGTSTAPAAGGTELDSSQFETAEDLDLEGRQVGAGHRITLAPPGLSDHVLPDGQAVGADGWQYHPEQDIGRPALEPRERDLIWQYFDTGRR